MHPPVDAILLPHGVGRPEEMRARIALAAGKEYRYIYVTDDTGSNPWDRLPEYWNEEVEAVRVVNDAMAG
jgi:hypothetical protein